MGTLRRGSSQISFGSICYICNGSLETNYLGIYWTDFHLVSPNGRYLIIDDRPGPLFSHHSRDVAMATNFGPNWRTPVPNPSPTLAIPYRTLNRCLSGSYFPQGQRSWYCSWKRLSSQRMLRPYSFNCVIRYVVYCHGNHRHINFCNITSSHLSNSGFAF